LLCSVLFAQQAQQAQEETSASRQGEVQLQLTLLDAPYNFEQGYSFPSMAQSLDLAYGIDRMAILGIQQGFGALFPEKEGLRMGLGLATTGVASAGLFFVGGWMHEEWHRAVMTSQGITSRNGIFHAEAWSQGTIAVDQVSDEGLAAMKADNPAYTVRLMQAGMEGEQALVRRLGDEAFFHGGQGRSLGPFYLADSWTAPLMAVTELSTLLYHAKCVDPENDALKDSENQRTLTVEQRDFTGLDCTAWVYDLFRPDEPYEERGPHPYGEGVDRYRGWSDLTPMMQDYLQLQLRLHLLDLVNPALYGINGLRLGDSGDRITFALGHTLTPWGFTVDGRLALKRGGFSGLLTMHNGLAQLGWCPGLDFDLFDLPLPWLPLALDAGVGLWLQPEDLRYDAQARRPGGRLRLDLSWPLQPRLDLWAGLEAKSQGWVMGQVYLEPRVSGLAGLRVHLR